MISPSRMPARETAKRPPPMKHVSFPAPRKGLLLSDNMAMQQPESAIMLENAVPTLTGVRMRGGKALRYTLPSAVISMFAYTASGVQRRFAATASTIYELGATAVAALGGRGSGYYVTTHMTNAGGTFMLACNGSDAPLIHDGASLANAALTMPAGRNVNQLCAVWTYANRLLFIEKNTLNAWFLPVDAIAGALQLVSLSGVFKKGGSLVFGATWSLDTGGGLNNRCVFVTDQGEAAIFRGLNPASVNDWGLDGVYDIGSKPVGPKACVQIGGDLLIATDAGIVPLTEAVRKDRTALALAAITRNIQPLWRDEVNARSAMPFEILKWAGNGLLVVSLPPASVASADACLVCNLDTGAWAKWTGWQTRCMALFNGRGWFGDNGGRIYEMEVGGSDGGAPYTMTCVSAYDHFGAAGITKSVTMGRLITKQASPHRARLSASVNYQTRLPPAPSSPMDYTTDEWDSGLWDKAKWDARGTETTRSQWVLIGKTGFCFAPQVQVTSGITPLPRIEIVGFDLVFEAGAVVV